MYTVQYSDQRADAMQYNIMFVPQAFPQSTVTVQFVLPPTVHTHIQIIFLNVKKNRTECKISLLIFFRRTAQMCFGKN
jgi:hypothetical protein